MGAANGPDPARRPDLRRLTALAASAEAAGVQLTTPRAFRHGAVARTDTSSMQPLIFVTAAVGGNASVSVPGVPSWP